MADSIPGMARALLRSSALRLCLILSALFAAGMAVSISVGLYLGQQAVSRQVDETLRGLAQGLAAEGVTPDRSALIVRRLDDLGDLPAPFAKVAAAGGGDVDLPREFAKSEEWRALVSQDARGNPILIAVPLEDSDDAVELVGAVLWATAAFVTLLSIGVGVGVGVLGQRRLSLISETLGRLAAGDLKARTGVRHERDDLDDIARDVDKAAGELERLVTQTRHLSASIAHDLRTPLARLRARLEALPQGEERSAALEEATRLSEVFDTIMRVARIEASQGSEGFAVVDLAALATETVEVFGPVVEDAGKSIVLDVARASQVHGDRAMLIQALGNLIQNAIVHGGDDISLRVNETSISIADNGPGVPAEQTAEIIKPMVRLDAARTRDGSGLGLALVKAVADRHGAKLLLAKEHPSGLAVTINFARM